MPRHPGSDPKRSSRNRKKKGAPVGLIVGLSLGGVAILGTVVAIAVLSTRDNAGTGQPDSETDTSEAKSGIFDLPGSDARQAEARPFHDEGVHEVGPLVREEIHLSNARFTGFGKTQSGLPFATWRLDYEMINGGFQKADLRDAYELRIRGGKLDSGVPQERAWTIRHPLNQAIYSESEASVQMLEPNGTVEVTWVIPEADYAPPYTFWVYRKDPQTEEFFLRVSKYASAPAEARP